MITLERSTSAFTLTAVGAFTIASTQLEKTDLQRIPLEILLQILDLLDFKDKLSLTYVSKELNSIAVVPLYRELYIAKSGDRFLNKRLSICYHFSKVNPFYYTYIQKLQGSVELLKLQGFVTDLSSQRQDLIYGKLTTLELSESSLPTVHKNLQRLSSLTIDSSSCMKSKAFIDNNEIHLRDHLKELTISGDPMKILNQFHFKLERVQKLRIVIQVSNFDYLQFGSLLNNVVDLQKIETLEIDFEASLNLSRNPYMIDLQSLSQLQDINLWLREISLKLSNLQNLSVIVKDHRRAKNTFKKIQPDISGFLLLLPNYETKLEKLSIKLSNEFSIKQFDNVLNKLKALKEFIFFGNLDTRYFSPEVVPNIKFDMLGDGGILKDYSMYGKFSKPESVIAFGEFGGDTMQQLTQDLQRLSCCRSGTDYLTDETIVCDIGPQGVFFLKTHILKNLQLLLNTEGQLYDNKALRRINLNGLIYDIDPSSRAVTCISD